MRSSLGSDEDQGAKAWEASQPARADAVTGPHRAPRDGMHAAKFYFVHKPRSVRDMDVRAMLDRRNSRWIDPETWYSEEE
jgi:hypothetical protein